MTEEGRPGDTGAAQTEREMREHEREARERDADERDAEGAATGDEDFDPREPPAAGQGRGSIGG
jgi:hypothetical protein